LIKSIELQNWKTHLNSRFDFSKGTNVLVGAMGSGKTSVMDAICFALFGTFPALQQRRIVLPEILMARPNQAEQATVKLVFDYDGKEFGVERIIKEKGSSEARLFIDGKFVAGPKPGDVNAAVERGIEISYNLFSRAVYSEQNQIDYFLRLSPGQRKERFDELLELDKYETVRGNAVSALNRLRGMAEDRRKLLRELEKDGMGKELKELGKKAGEKEKLLVELKNAMERKRKGFELLKKQVKGLEEKEKRFNELNEVVTKNQYLAEKLEKEVKEGEGQLKGLTAEAVEKDIEEKQGRLKGIEKEIAEIEKSEKELIEKASAAKQEIRGNELKIIEIGKQTKEVEAAGANCPVCKSPLDENKKGKIAAENKQSIEALQVKNKRLSVKIAEMDKERIEMEKEAEERKRKRVKVEEELIELNKLLELSKKIGEQRKQLAQLKKGMEKARKEIAELGFDEAKAKKARETLVRQEAEIEANKKEQLNVGEILKNIEGEIEKAEKRLEQIKQFKESVKAIEENSEKLQLFVNGLRETQAQLRESLIETINEAMDSIWQKIYPYADYSSAKMAVEKGNYELAVRDSSGKWVRVEGILSGGERSAAAICIRIAFSLVLTRNLSWIILDEPTHNLDTAAVSSLSRMMRENLPELIEQIFVITHDKEMEKAASGSLYLLKRNKAIDEPTAIAPIALEG